MTVQRIDKWLKLVCYEIMSFRAEVILEKVRMEIGVKKRSGQVHEREAAFMAQYFK